MFVLGCFFVLVELAAAHQGMLYPPSRYPGANGAQNGFIYGDNVAGTSDNARQDNNRHYVLKAHPSFRKYPCGGAPIKNYKQTVYNGGGDIEAKPNQFDVSSVPNGAVVTTLQAGSEIKVTAKGYHHPGVASVSICYENCMDLANYEKFILGYYFHQGVNGKPPGATSGSIYDAVIGFTVKVPMRNSNQAVLRWADDTDDGRSYVSCADVTIVGGSNTATSVECNGHPFCDCTLPPGKPGDTSAGPFGLHKACPSNVRFPIQEAPEGPWSWTQNGAQSAVEQLGVNTFCSFCANEGCPAACGSSKWGSAYVNRNGNPLKNSVVHPSSLDKPTYVTCDAANSCNCPGCLNPKPWGTNATPKPTPQATPKPTPQATPKPTPKATPKLTPKAARCEGDECGTHGICNMGACYCKDSYYGDKCDKILDKCEGVDCGTHGICNMGTCYCKDSYYGDKCDKAPDDCVGRRASQNEEEADGATTFAVAAAGALVAAAML